MSEMFKRFFAGEICVLCSLPDFWRKVTVLEWGPATSRSMDRGMR